MAVTPSRPESDSLYFEQLLRVAKAWRLRDRETQQLVGAPERTFYRWKAGRPKLSDDQRDRISHLVNVQSTLEAIFNENKLSFEWVRRPNAAFSDRTPLELMLEDRFAGILRVRTYLSELL